jgi:APA family basic amino acid/polyamine antiporter
MSPSTPAVSAPAPSRLARKLGMFDAVVIGLGSMLGAGVFVAFGPAAAAAGSGLLAGLLVAAFVAYANADSSASLAALYPESGGTYVYGRKRLGAFWGFLAGWAFITGKLASCAAMAMTFGLYASPALARTLAVAAVLVLTGVNVLGIRKTALLTRLIVFAVLAALAWFVGAVWLGGTADAGRILSDSGSGVFGVLRSAGFLFFAFAGYARLATLGEEVKEPARIIPRAIPLALGAALCVYAAVGVSALAGAGAPALAASSAPLATAVEGGGGTWSAGLVRAGATIACLGVLLSLLAGISRTAFAMASERDLPGFLAAVDPRARVPHRAVLITGALVAALCALVDVCPAIGFSSFTVLIYYAIANAAAWTLPMAGRRWRGTLPAAGLLGCLALAVTLPTASVFAGAAVLAVGASVFLARRHFAPEGPNPVSGNP